MCAHFIYISQDEIERIIADVQNSIKAGRKDVRHSNASALHAYPKADVPIIVNNELAGKMKVEIMRWGYPVSWQKDVMFNTKIETALGDKHSMWDDSIQNRRCIIPSFGFYEPHMTETRISSKSGKPIKVNYFFRMPDSEILWMAGVFEDGHFSIVTTEPNQWISSIHRRMPLVLLPDELDAWLYGEYTLLGNRENVQLVSEKVA